MKRVPNLVRWTGDGNEATTSKLVPGGTPNRFDHSPRHFLGNVAANFEGGGNHVRSSLSFHHCRKPRKPPLENLLAVLFGRVTQRSAGTCVTDRLAHAQ